MPNRKITKYFRNAAHFLKHDIWNIDHRKYGGGKARGVRYLKILLVTLRGMSSHKVGLQAAALTFFSLIAIVPFIAVVYAVTRGFGLAGELESIIYANFGEQEQMLQWILSFADNLLNTSKSGFFGIIGFLTFCWSIVWLMISVEQMFNHVWQVKNDHSIPRRALAYSGFMILSPLLILGLFMIPLSYNNFVQATGWNLTFLNSLKPVVGWFLHFVLFALLFWAAFIFIPNAKVRMLPALYAALFTALAFVVLQALYVGTQVLVSKLNAVYGVFAALPFFMMWLNINWFLILLGAELSFAFQNYDRYGTQHPL